MMKKFIKITLKMCFALIFIMATSCSSKENELVGSWRASFGLNDDYLHERGYSDSKYSPTFIQTITFYQGVKSESGTFTDVIAPIVISSQNDEVIKIGSKLSGTWEVKEKKIYMYFDENSLSLINDDMIDETDKSLLENQISQNFFGKYKDLCANGLKYEIFHKNNKTGLKIMFGNTKVTLIKKVDKN